ncbi:MAG TPA: hypothetical protein VFZ76_11600 [Anaerolineales bacterium]
MRTKLVLTLMILTATSLLSPDAAKSANGDAGVVGRFSHGGMILRMTSELEFEELWGLVINYCDGSREEIWHRFPSKIEYRARLGATGYNFYADKPMKRVLIKTLPIEATGEQVINFRFTTVRRKCDKPEPPPKLYCSNVQVAPVINRSWEGEPIEFKSSRHVVRAGLRFPGVDGLAPAREPIFNQRIYRPSVRFDAAEHTWRGTFMSLRIPVGEYTKVELVVQDDFGEQAKCPVGKLTVMP